MYVDYEHFVSFLVARVKRGRVLSVLVCVWIFSLFWTVCPLAGWNAYTPEPYGVSCSLHWYGKGISDKVYIWLVLFFVYVFPLAIMVFSYSRIARHARRLACTPQVRNEENKSKFLYNLERGATKARPITHYVTCRTALSNATVRSDGFTRQCPMVHVLPLKSDGVMHVRWFMGLRPIV